MARTPAPFRARGPRRPSRGAARAVRCGRMPTPPRLVPARIDPLVRAALLLPVTLAWTALGRTLAHDAPEPWPRAPGFVLLALVCAYTAAHLLAAVRVPLPRPRPLPPPFVVVPLWRPLLTAVGDAVVSGLVLMLIGLSFAAVWMAPALAVAGMVNALRRNARLRNIEDANGVMLLRRRGPAGRGPNEADLIAVRLPEAALPRG